MDPSKMTYVLGGDDTEMREIETILEDYGYNFTYATDKLGNRLSRRQAYDTVLPKIKRDQVWIECRPGDFGNNEMISLGYTLIDHHSEGDPGYGVSSGGYWKASSLGQLCNFIGHEKTIELQMIAAADHCLHHAYNNGCSPITREQLLAFRLSHFREGMTAAIEGFQDMLAFMRKNQTREFNGTMYFDASNVKRNGFFVTDASAYGNIPFISVRQKRGHDFKKVFLGNASRKDISYFLEGGHEEFGELINAFGDPNRQFAGAYFKRDDE